MADITIHRCTLRVVRRAGWSWGAEPDALLKAAIGALPLLIARKLADHFPHETETTISDRLSLRVPISLSELMALAAHAGAVVEADELKPNAALDQRINAAIKSSLAGKLEADREQIPAEVSEKTEPISVNPERERRAVRVHRVFQLLLAWKYLGEAEVHLASFSEAELKAWYDALLATCLRFAAAAGPLEVDAVSRRVQAIQQTINAAGTNRAAALRSSLITLLDAALELESVSGAEPELDFDRAADPAAIDLLPELKTFSHDPRATATEVTPETQQAETPEPFVQPHLMQAEPTSRRVAEMDFRVSSVLPFLLLSPLAKIGYFDALAATLETINLSNQAHLFATALAFKVLSPPERGWRRTDQDLTAAAVFAGLDTAPAGDDLAELARKMNGHLTALDSIVSYALVKAHDPSSPLLLLRTLSEAEGEGLLLVETDGLVPIAWGANPDDLKPSLKYFSENHLLIEHDSADIETLRALHAAGYRFITDAPPSRGEMWRELRRPPVRRWYTNDFDTAEVELVRAADRLAGTTEAAASVWQAVKLQRPAFPTARNAELELSLTMAAALSLGTISWTLWRDRETATPQLALERFGNLDGRVRFRANTIQVQLPLGRRQRDLYEHGLLGPVHDVPWFDGRTVEFLGG